MALNPLFQDFNILISLLLPVLSSPIAYLLTKRKKKFGGIFCFLVLLASFFLILIEFPNIISNTKVVESYPWIPAFNLNFGLKLDGLSYPIALVISLVSSLSALASVSYMEGEENHSSYYLCLLLFADGMLGSVLATNLLQFYFFFELMVIPSYFLIAYWGHKEAKKIGFKYFLWTRVAGLFLLVASLLVYSRTGTFSISGTERLPFISFLFLVAFFIKMAIFPLHNWLPDAHSEAPAPISAMLSGAMIKVGGYGIIRIVLRLLGFQFGSYLNIFFGLALITMFYGAMLALVQDDLKRLLAFSSISHMGYVFFGILSIQKLGYLGSIFHMFNHGMAKGLLFLGSASILYSTGTRDMKKLGGLIKKMPITAFSMIVGALSLAGTPPLSGFLSEFFMFGGMLSGNHYLCTALGLIATVLTLAYYLVMIRKVFFGEGKPKNKETKETPYITVPLLVLAVVTIVFGIWPQPILNLISSFL